ncbi:MAG: NAD-binding protein [Longimicrobiales bacterium]
MYAAGLAGFLSGVGVTERSLVDAGVWERAYYTLGLFVLGGMDLGTPVGGPDFGRGLLWVAFFAAPVITASAIVEAVVRLVAPLTLRVRPLRNHVVLGGAGRLTLLYLARLRERDPRCTAVVVERDPSHPALNAVRELYGGVVIVGDITRDETLARVRLDRARRVLFLTGDDFANLDAAAKALRVAPGTGGPDRGPRVESGLHARRVRVPGGPGVRALQRPRVRRGQAGAGASAGALPRDAVP